MMTQQLRAEAAEARSRQVRAPGDRPSQRRAQSERAGGAWTPAIPGAFTVRGLDTGTGPLVFDGMATVYERGYEMWDMFGPYTEFVHLGSGAASLATPELDVPLVLGHDPMRRLARTVRSESTLSLTEVNDGETPGLRVLAPNLDRADPDVAYIAPKLRSGLIDEMSFRFMIVSGRWNDAWDEYHIHAYDIHRGDVSIVGYGANPFTAGSGLRAAAADGKRALRREVQQLARRAQNRALTPADQQSLTALFGAMAGAEAALDPIVEAVCTADMVLEAGGVTLAGILGLPAPADGGMASGMAEEAADDPRARIRRQMLLDRLT